MIQALVVLLLCQLAGEIIARILALPVPGPVMGMLLLWVILLVRGSVPTWLRVTSQGMLQHLSLLFVPAGVGIMVHFALLQSEWLALVITIIASTVITIAVTAITMHVLLRLMQK